MIFKKTALLVSLIIAACFFWGCSKEDIYIDDTEDDNPIRIFCLFPDSFIDGYNKTKPKGTREIELVEIDFRSIEDIKDAYDNILKEITLGGGPDIIFISNHMSKSIDLHKTSESNAFADMDILIENSETFNFNDFKKDALDAGIINDKRVLIPISYYSEYMIGVKESFEYNGLEIPEEFTMDTFIGIVEDYYQNTNSPAFFNSWEPYYLLSEFIQIGKPIEKSDRLKRLFEVFKEDHKRNNDYQNTVNNFTDNFLNDHILFYNTWKVNQYGDLHMYYNILNNKNESNMIIFEMPINENRFSKAYINEGFLININSKHKNEAFIEYVLSEQVQSQLGIIPNLPINKKAYENRTNGFFDGYCGCFDYDFGVEETEIPMELKMDYVDYINNFQSYEYLGIFNYIYFNIAKEIIEDYYNDKITFDEMIDEINNKLSIYYTE